MSDIAVEIREALQPFVGQRNTPETRARIMRAIDAVLAPPSEDVLVEDGRGRVRRRPSAA